MRQRSKHSKQLRSFLIVGIVLTLILILIVSTVGRKDFKGPHKLAFEIVGGIQAGFSKVIAGFDGIWDDYIAIVGVKKENGALLEEIRLLKAQNNNFLEAAATNVRLTKLLEMKETIAPPTLTAEIIGKDPSQWFKTIIINRGSSDGVKKGMPVVTVEGVVGQVKNTAPHFSKVLLANDPNSAIDVSIQKNRVQGIIKGNGKGGFSLQYVLKNYAIEKGDRVITSGVGGVFPKGLATGTVISAVKGRRGMFQQIEVEPDVDFSKLEYLFVILKENPFSE